MRAVARITTGYRDRTIWTAWADRRVGASAEEGGGVVVDFAGCGERADRIGCDGRDRLDSRAGGGVEHAEAGGTKHRERADGASWASGGPPEDFGCDEREETGDESGGRA